MPCPHADPAARRPAFEVADVFLSHGEAYRQAHTLSGAQQNAMRDIEACRTQARWIEQRCKRLLPTHSFHVVFTLPAELRSLVRRNRRRLFALLFEAGSAALLDLAADPERLLINPDWDSGCTSASIRPLDPNPCSKEPSMGNAPGPMICPRCPATPLNAVMTKQGVEVDRCHSCGGIWLDRGEIYYFAKKPKPLIVELKRARKAARPGELKSPKTGQPMLQMHLFDQVEVDLCPDTEGIWLDQGELEQVVTSGTARLQMQMDRSVAAGAGSPPAEITPARIAAYAAGARRLPNLFLRSTALLITLYGLLTLILIAVVELGGLSPAGALIIGLAIAALQFGLGPFLMDWSLRWFYQCRWIEKDELPEHLRAFIARVAGQRKIKFPRMGIIEDGAPNAFTYGHHPSNARIVITRGLFELLDERELESVVAHEIGHAVHWDMLIMTMANLVPLVAYYVYRTLIRIRSRGNDRTAGARYAIAMGAFVVYIISEYIVLWLSRTREYKADHFAGVVTGEPNLLARALVKIGYGLAGRKDARARAKEEKKSGARERTPNLEAIGALGIFDAGAARALAVSSSGQQLAGGLDGEQLKGAMRWDLWNPWARWYELNSSHPLVAHRLDYLGRQAAQIGQAPLVIFDEVKPESYWDEFLFDLVVLLTPWLLAGGLLAAGLARDDGRIVALAVSGFGLGVLLRALWSYRGGSYPEMSVAALLKKVKVSAIRGVPCTVRGKVIGRGVPGLIWSEDFVLQDETGILFMDYRQPLRIWEFLFGLMRRGAMQGEEVVATGWYRRAPVPYLELSSLRAQGRTRRCWVYPMKIVGSIVLIGLGLFLAMKAGR